MKSRVTSTPGALDPGMCIFSGPVAEVSATSILARPHRGRQLLVYQMSVIAPEPVAMVLPVPTRVGAGDDAIRFHDLSGYPDFFADLRQAFGTWTFGPGLCAHELALPPLPIHEVGSFVASFVPSVADFGRLAPRFRLADGVLAGLDRFADWGFVVFQLASHPGLQTVHPMAFELETRHPDRLYLPTTHVHDGAVPARATFDHDLYLMGETEDDPWELALEQLGHDPMPLRGFGSAVDLPRLGALSLPAEPSAARIVLDGTRANTDTWFSPRLGLRVPPLL